MRDYLEWHRLSGMDMTLSDYDGRTALHLASSEGHLDSVEFLIEHCGVPHDPKDRWGNRPIDEAETFGHAKVVEYLKNHEKIQQAEGGGKSDKNGDNDNRDGKTPAGKNSSVQSKS